MRPLIRQLREYQTRAIALARRAIVEERKRAVLVVAPTGSGKTVMLTEIVRGHVARGGKVVWSAHRRELISQAASTLEGAGLTVGYRGLRAGAPIQVESIQSILSRGSAPEGTMCVIDEGHHYVADEWKALPALFAHALIIGATATPERGDGRGLGIAEGGVFDHLIVAAQIKELTALGYLVPCAVFAPKQARAGKTLELSPVDAYLRYAPDSSGVVFCPHVQAAHDFAAQFVERGLSARVITGQTPADLRDRSLYEFARGNVKVLLNVHVLTEGWDAPRAATCILARRIGSAGAYLQAIGRVLRPFPGKDCARLLDLYGSNVGDYGAPDAERLYSLEGRAIQTRDVLSPSFCKLHALPTPCPECALLPSDMRTPDDAGGELDKWDGFRKANGTVDKRVARLAALLKKSRENNYKPGWVTGAFRRMFRFHPSKELMQLAEAQLAGEFAIGERDSHDS